MAGLVEGKRISGSFLPRDDDGRVRMFAGYVTGNICSACGKDGAYECKECKAVGFCHPGCPEYKRIEDDHNQVCHDMGMAMSDKSQAHHNPVDPLVPTSDAPKHWGALKDWSTWGKKRINMAATTVEKSGSTMRVSARAVSPVMTVWSAMGLMGIRTHNKSYVIHVLGPDDRHELMWDMKPWRELASMMPDSPSVTIEFIGPAVPAEKTGTTHEPPLHRRLTINYHQMYYQAYVGTDAALEPDLVFIAHSALHEPEHQATWQPAVRHCIHEGLPMLFTSPNEHHHNGLLKFMKPFAAELGKPSIEGENKWQDPTQNYTLVQREPNVAKSMTQVIFYRNNERWVAWKPTSKYKRDRDESSDDESDDSDSDDSDSD